MRNLNDDEYFSLRTDAAVLERDRHGDKVLRLRDGSFLKLFRRKRLLSSTAWYPYAKRFVDNSLALEQRGIPCPQVIAVFRISGIQRDAVHYWPLPGQTIRQLVQAGKASTRLRQQVLAFVARLHTDGVYFRSLHLGNIVLMPDGRLGLIDIADMRLQPYPLLAYQRHRNRRHLYRDPGDQAWLQADT